MKKWNMIIDVSNCHDCNNCFLACKDEYVANDWLPYSAAQPQHGHRWMNIMRREQGQYPKVDVAYLPLPCMHCDDAPCIKFGKQGAVRKRDDGIVIIDPEKAKGQKDLITACPYGAIWWNPEKALPQKCTFCAHLLAEGWKEPRCVQACPTGAIEIKHVADEEMNQLIEQEKLETYRPDLQVKQRVYYRNLYRYTQCFIAGSVALRLKNECAEGAKVTLHKDSQVLETVETNNYGDFKFHRLDEDSGEYVLEVTYPGSEAQQMGVKLAKSINVGTIFL